MDSPGMTTNGRLSVADLLQMARAVVNHGPNADISLIEERIGTEVGHIQMKATTRTRKRRRQEKQRKMLRQSASLPALQHGGPAVLPGMVASQSSALLPAVALGANLPLPSLPHDGDIAAFVAAAAGSGGGGDGAELVARPVPYIMAGTLDARLLLPPRIELPDLMPSMMPVDIVRVRASERVRHGKKVRRLKRIANDGKEAHYRQLLDEKEERRRLYKARKAGNKIASAWLPALALAAVTATWRDRFRAALRGQVARAVRQRAAAAIQRNYTAYKKTALWKKYARYASIMHANKWRLALQVRCFRRYRCANVLQAFFEETGSSDFARVVKKFVARVKRVQAFAQKRNAHTEARLSVMRPVWAAAEDALVERTAAALARDTAMTTIEADAEARGGDEAVRRQLGTKAVDVAVTYWKQTDAAMEQLLESQRKHGRIEADAPAVPRLSPEARDAALRAIITAQRKAFVLRAEKLVASEIQATLRHKEFTQDEAKYVMFSKAKGVRKLEKIPGTEVSAASLKSQFFFFTSFTALTPLRSVVTHAHDAAHKKKYGNIIENERKRRSGLERDHGTQARLVKLERRATVARKASLMSRHPSAATMRMMLASAGGASDYSGTESPLMMSPASPTRRIFPL